MKRTHLVLAALLAAGGLTWGRAALAAEDPVDFVHALEEKGYADIAKTYLEDLKERRRLGPDMTALYDFEMSKCLRSAAKQAYNPAEYALDMAAAKDCLRRFIDEHGNRPEVQVAIVWWAGFATDEAMDHLRKAQDPAIPKATKAEELAATRKCLEEAKPRLQEAAGRFREQMRAVKGTKKRDKLLRLDLEAKWQNAAFQSILCDYYLAQTYDDPKDPQRRETLEKAAKEFDDIFQANRESEMGVYAHMWQGKTVMELGDDLELAKDIFDEVLANFETGGGVVFTRESGALYAQVKEFSLQLGLKDPAKDPKEAMKEFIKEAREWHEIFRRNNPQTGGEFVRTAEGYQGVSLTLAKALLEQAEKATGPEKGKLKTEAAKILAEMAKIFSSHQKEANDLAARWGASPGATPSRAASTRPASRAMMRSSHKKWEEAIGCYNKALHKATKKDASKLSKVKDAIGMAYFLMAHDQFGRGKVADCLKTLKTLIEDYHETSAAPKGAALAVGVKFYQYQAIPVKQAKERAAALQEVIDAAEYTRKNWPAKPEADDARMILGRLYFADGETDKAMAEFEAVNSHSERYAMALYLDAYVHWSLYRQEKAKPEGSEEKVKPGARKEKRKSEATRDKKAMALHMEKAIEALVPSVELQQKARKAAGEAEMPQPLIDAQVMLANIYLEAGEAKKAAAQFQPLIDELTKRKPKTLDNTMLDIFLGAVRAYVATNDLPKASVAGMTLVDLGPDTERVNDALLRFAMLLEGERKKAEAAVIAAVGDKETAEAKERLAGMNEMLGKLLTKLASREKVSPKGMVWIAETCSKVGLDDAAEKQCLQFLKRMEEDAEFRGNAGHKKDQAKAITRVRARLIGILGKKGAFVKAVAQATSLVKDNPRSLDARMEECRLRYNWAMKDPQQVIAAQTACEALRANLNRGKGQKPPEYYEVAYYEADLFCTQAKELAKKGNKADAAAAADKADSVLKNGLFFNPKLDGPDRVAQYKKLLAEAAQLQK